MEINTFEGAVPTVVPNPVPIINLEARAEVLDSDVFAIGTADGSKAYKVDWATIKSTNLADSDLIQTDRERTYITGDNGKLTFYAPGDGYFGQKGYARIEIGDVEGSITPCAITIEQSLGRTPIEARVALISGELLMDGRMITMTTSTFHLNAPFVHLNQLPYLTQSAAQYGLQIMVMNNGNYVYQAKFSELPIHTPNTFPYVEAEGKMVYLTAAEFKQKLGI